VAPHSGDWLLSVPIANCGLRLDDEAVRVAVGMRLGVSLCVPHKCRCGAEVDAQARHAMISRKAPDRIARHHALNDIVWRALNSAGVPSIYERADGFMQTGRQTARRAFIDPVAKR